MKTIVALFQLAYLSLLIFLRFGILIIVEIYMVSWLVPYLIETHNMNPEYGKYIWGLTVLIILYEIVIFILNGIWKTFKTVFKDIFN